MSANDISRAVWQISGGPASRAYGEVFLRHGVALIGPGDAGPWSMERYEHDFALQGFVGRFADEITVGDVFLLRTGTATISAVGIVASEYLYLDRFDDVNGWDLQHVRRVRWSTLPQEHTLATQVFGASPTRCSRVWQKEALDFAQRFLNSPPTHWQTAPVAVPSEGLDQSVARDHQASSVDGQVRRLSAAFPLARWAETETARLLRLSGKARGAQRGPRAACFFDHQARLEKSDARRRQNPDDQRRRHERQRGH